MINLKKVLLISIICCFIKTSSYAQSDSLITKTKVEKWYETINLRGYMQIRYNRLLETNSNLGCQQCDASWGGTGGFLIRRARLIFSGNLTKQIYFYIQPDFASTANSLHFAQLRDAYFDLGFDHENKFRLRIGQSKVPFGFENLQSSQNRLPLDRNDALNSAVANERDLGVFFYWAPKSRKDIFKDLVSSGLKGSGDYGVVGFGVYNGQTANLLELNSEPHFVARITYPFKIKSQILEIGIQGYTGKYILPNVSSSIKKKQINYSDERIAASFMLYPKPFGIQAEFNIGNGPKFSKYWANGKENTDSIGTSTLLGGYVQAMYMLKLKKHIIIPFARYQYFEGGKKHELDARSYVVHEGEIGVEWQPSKYFELVIMYTISSRRYEDAAKPNNLQEGNLLRIQAQINF